MTVHLNLVVTEELTKEVNFMSVLEPDEKLAIKISVEYRRQREQEVEKPVWMELEKTETPRIRRRENKQLHY